jgi:nicotinate-nucleotide adenylyltransferase
VRRLGIYGGSFDPVHAGHVHAATAAEQRFGLDAVVFVPAAQPPHKPGVVLASGADRMAMLELALCEHPHWSVSAIELERDGPSYTVDTLRSLPARLGLDPGAELFLILGSDNLGGLPLWKRAREVLERAQPIVVDRGGDLDEGLAAVRRELPTELVQRVERGLLRLPPVEASASEVRTALSEGRVPPPVVPASVLEYIRAHGIYGAARPRS